MHVAVVRWIVKAALFTALVSHVSAETPDSSCIGVPNAAEDVSFEPEVAEDEDDRGPCCYPSHRHRHQHDQWHQHHAPSSRWQQSMNWPGEEIGHYQFPYHSYRRPWYYPGQPIYNRTIAW